MNNTFNYLEFLTKNEDTEVYYMFRCDDKRSPSHIKPDMSFDLTDTESVNKLLNECNNLKLNYDFCIEVFNHPDSEIINSINFVSNNYINNNIFHMEQQIEAKKKEIEELQKNIEKNLVV